MLLKWIALAMIIAGIVGARARDPGGKYAQANPELHKWFEEQRSGKGPCCSDADGTALQDTDWEGTGDGAFVPRQDRRPMVEGAERGGAARSEQGRQDYRLADRLPDHRPRGSVTVGARSRRDPLFRPGRHELMGDWDNPTADDVTRALDLRRRGKSLQDRRRVALQPSHRVPHAAARRRPGRGS
jgi:hypothetical protein